MKVEKIINTTESTELEISGATLLSIEEYEEYKDNIPLFDDSLFDDLWWLRSPGDSDICATYITLDGYVITYGGRVNIVNNAVRPALKISNLSSSNLSIKDKFIFSGKTFTVISKDYALCDETIGNCPFRKDWGAKGANVYEASDVKKFVDNWFDSAVRGRK